MERNVDQIIDSAVSDCLLTHGKPHDHVRSQLVNEGYFIISPDRIQREDIERFISELEKPEPRFAYFRGVLRLFGIPLPDYVTIRYRRAAKSFAESYYGREHKDGA